MFKIVIEFGSCINYFIFYQIELTRFLIESFISSSVASLKSYWVPHTRLALCGKIIFLIKSFCGQATK